MQQQQQRPRSEGRLLSPSFIRQRFAQEHRRTSTPNDMSSSMGDGMTVMTTSGETNNNNGSTSPNARRPRTTPKARVQKILVGPGQTIIQENGCATPSSFMTHLPDSPPREPLKPNIFISPAEAPRHPSSGSRPSSSMGRLSPDQAAEQMAPSASNDSDNETEEQDDAADELSTEKLPTARSNADNEVVQNEIKSDRLDTDRNDLLETQNTDLKELPLWEKVTQESDTIRQELMKYLTELEQKTDENGTKLVMFPSNYNQIVSLMTSDDLKSSSDAPSSDQKKKKKMSKATDLAAQVTGTSWSQVLLQTALEKEDAYGSSKSKIGESGDGNEEEMTDSPEEKLRKKIALGLAKIRENDLILEKLKPLAMAASVAATGKKKVFKAPEEPEESTVSPSLDKKQKKKSLRDINANQTMDQGQPTNKSKSLTSKNIKSLNNPNSRNGDVTKSNRPRVAKAPAQEEEETKRLKTFVTELQVKSPRSVQGDIDNDDTKSMKSATSSKVSRATKGGTGTGLIQKTFVERNRELVENGAKTLTKEEEDRVNALLGEDDDETEQTQGQEDDNGHSGSLEEPHQPTRPHLLSGAKSEALFASSAFAPAETEKLRDLQLDQLLQTLHTRMTTARPLSTSSSSSGYFSLEVPEEMFVCDLKLLNPTAGITRQSSKTSNIVATVANELQDARLERLKSKRLEEIEQRLLLLKMEQEEEMVLMNMTSARREELFDDEEDQQSVASFQTRTSISSCTSTRSITRKQMNSLVSEARQEFLQGQEIVQKASQDEIKRLLATLPPRPPEIIETTF